MSEPERSIEDLVEDYEVAERLAAVSHHLAGRSPDERVHDRAHKRADQASRARVALDRAIARLQEENERLRRALVAVREWGGVKCLCHEGLGRECGRCATHEVRDLANAALTPKSKP